MGRFATSESSLSTEPLLWPNDELPQHRRGLGGRNFKSLRFPLWTQNKARLIQAYLQLFVYITRHGTYIDGFAAPQDATHLDAWAAKLVLEMEPRRIRDIWLCDLSAKGIEKLEELRTVHMAAHLKPKRRITVLAGDFNTRVSEILQSGRITEKTATFALIDQRTFECEWRTVEALSRHKTGNKIELFYFFPTGWIDRSIAAVKRPEKQAEVERWWGRPDWASLRGMDGLERARMVATRFERELGYGKAEVFPIHDEKQGGRVMYHMIHASDHPEALALMVRAYRKVSGRPDLSGKEEQLDLMDLLRDIQDEGASNQTGSTLPAP
jgi:three-Cys-motif partner protein